MMSKVPRRKTMHILTESVPKPTDPRDAKYGTRVVSLRRLYELGDARPGNDVNLLIYWRSPPDSEPYQSLERTDKLTVGTATPPFD